MTTQANNVAIESSQINSSGVLTVAGGGTGLAAPGTSGNVLVSNGTAWTSAAPSSGGATGQYIIQSSNAAAPSGYVLAGNAYLQASYPALFAQMGILAGPNSAKSWTLRDPGANFGVSEAVYSAVYGAGTWVAVGTNGNVSTSTDGVTWTPQTALSVGILDSVSFNGTNLFVATGNTGKIFTSPDGINWTQRVSSFGAGDRIYNSAYAAGKWIAVGDNGGLATSPDGVTWTQQASATAIFTTNTIYDVSYGNGLWVAVGALGLIATSPDGVTWTQQNSNFIGNSIFSIDYGNGFWTIVGQAGKLATSSDGVTWAIQNPTTTSTFTSVNFGKGLWIVPTGSPATILVSSDGITWVQQPISQSAPRIVVYGNGMYVGCGSNGGSGAISTSTLGYDITTQFVVPNPWPGNGLTTYVKS